MGYSILELVIQRLREADIPADTAYPGRMLPNITGPVAAVHLEKVDASTRTVTVETVMLCPAAMGGTACELAALRAAAVLEELGAVCVQGHCVYDRVGQVYSVAVLAAFTGSTGAAQCELGPGFQVYLNERWQPHVLSASAEGSREVLPEYSMGQSALAGISSGGEVWSIRLEELIPPGAAEPEEPEADFQIKIVAGQKAELYSGCQWRSMKREYTKNGLRRVREGIAQARKEEWNG